MSTTAQCEHEFLGPVHHQPGKRRNPARGTNPRIQSESLGSGQQTERAQVVGDAGGK